MRTAKRIMFILSITALLCCLLSAAAFAAEGQSMSFTDVKDTD